MAERFSQVSTFYLESNHLSIGFSSSPPASTQRLVRRENGASQAGPISQSGSRPGYFLLRSINPRPGVQFFFAGTPKERIPESLSRLASPLKTADLGNVQKKKKNV
jgi:hypothetical protein